MKRARLGLVVVALVAVGVCPTPGRSGTHRQGGDTIAEAVTITIPCEVSGTTIGYADDYEESCPGSSWAPDVVYQVIPDQDLNAEIDLLDSLYDTQVFVYDSDLDLVACNTDFFGDQSYLRNVPLAGGSLYYVIVDGDWSAAGIYTMRIDEYVPCDLGCVGEAEGEPALFVGYIDEYNSGCAIDETDPPVQRIDGDLNGETTLCGRNGWYLDDYGQRVRDYDCFVVTVGADGSVDVTFSQQEPTYVIAGVVEDCNNYEIIGSWEGPYCGEETETFTAPPGTEVWIQLIPAGSDPPNHEDVYEFDYTLAFSGLDVAVAVRERSWSSVRATFR